VADALQLHHGEALAVLATLPADSADAVVTSPPYWRLRDYGHPAQLGQEPDVRKYVARIVAIFGEVRRVLRPEGVAWVNLGDTYAGEGGGGQGIRGGRVGRKTRRFPRKVSPGLKPKDLVGAPWRVALALQDDGWWLRSEVIWQKPNPLPESVNSRPARCHEHVFLFAKSADHYFDGAPLREPARRARPGRIEGRDASHPWEPPADGMRTGRTVWTLPTIPSDRAHPAPWPPQLARRLVLSACPPEGLVLDPFCGGSGAAAIAAIESGRCFVGIDLNLAYLDLTRAAVAARVPLLATPA
jgi:DNA modification methylase